jgi:hypothetical protein
MDEKSVAFTSATESDVWLRVHVALRRAGSGFEQATYQADRSVAAWRERHPRGYANYGEAKSPPKADTEKESR